MFHELAHSTGHVDRLGRFKGEEEETQFASESYSKEELVAELASSFLCAEAGIEKKTLERSAAYLDQWIKTLKADPKILVSAGTQAAKAATSIRGESS